MQPCTLRLPDCRNQVETTVFAHAPSIDNGMGLKTAKDFWGAFACSHCHDVADGRKTVPGFTLWMVDQRWLKGIYETQSILIAKGLLQYDDG
jgi:hypothetical protein